MDDARPIRAPRSRQALAALVDVALVGAAMRIAGGPKPNRRTPWAALGPELLREQLRTPGQVLLGLRTIDGRTGERVELWRSLVLAAARIGGQRLVDGLLPREPTPEQARERERFLAELNAIYERHPQDSRARDAERARLYERAPRRDVRPALVAALANGIVNRALRRRLAPTREVFDRR